MPHDVDEGKMLLELAAKRKGQGAGRAQSLLDLGLGQFATPVVCCAPLFVGDGYLFVSQVKKKNFKDYKMGGNSGQEL